MKSSLQQQINNGKKTRHIKEIRNQSDINIGTAFFFHLFSDLGPDRNETIFFQPNMEIQTIRII